MREAAGQRVHQEAFEWPAFQGEFQQRMDSWSGNRYPKTCGRASVPLTKLLDRKAQIIRHDGRRHRFDGNLPFDQIGKEVIGVPAVVMDSNQIISLLRQGFPETPDQGSVLVWHDDFFDCVWSAAEGLTIKIMRSKLQLSICCAASIAVEEGRITLF
jgi:hypothetical protein